MTPVAPEATVLVDVGRSHLRVVAEGAAAVDTHVPGGVGVLGADAAVTAARTVAAAVRTAVPATADTRSWRLAVCAPGIVTDAAAAQLFADSLATAFPAAPARVLVVSDSAAWQTGAFAGGEGAALALGTGAVAVARIGDRVLRLDGRGLLLGDTGGGAWIGWQALRAADADPDGELHAAAIDRFGPASGWPRLLDEPGLPARLASFVPDVAAAATRGDTDADRVLDAAAAALTDTLEPLPADLPVAVVGGLAPLLTHRLARRSPRRWVEPVGDAVAGLRLLLADTGAYGTEAFHGRPCVTGGHDTDLLPTEAVAPDTTDLDTWPTDRLVTRLAAGHQGAAGAVLAAVGPLTRAAELAGTALAGTGRLVYVGAGTPGRLAVQDAAELTPTYNLDPARVPVLLAGGQRAGTTAVEGAEDDADAGAEDVTDLGVGPGDVVIGIAASGRTPYVLAAITRAAQRGAATVGICNVPDSPLAAAADIAVELLTGPEVIAGSTRLAAGTAQKIALNTLSTAAMVRAGATFGPWMVDMLASNDKLRRRAQRMVRDAAGVTDEQAVTALDAAAGSVQVALVMLLAGLDPEAARERLRSAGSVRAALDADAAAVRA